MIKIWSVSFIVSIISRYNSYLAPNGECTLEFDNMSPKDVGKYKVYAENTNGADFINIKLDLAGECF